MIKRSRKQLLLLSEYNRPLSHHKQRPSVGSMLNCTTVCASLYAPGPGQYKQYKLVLSKRVAMFGGQAANGEYWCSTGHALYIGIQVVYQPTDSKDCEKEAITKTMIDRLIWV